MKSVYVHELREQGAVCEGNFLRLRRLLRDFPEGLSLDYQVQAEPHVDADIRLQVTERFRYTATVDIMLHQHHLPEPFARQTFRVRVYLDANTSEVMTLERVGSLQGVYNYPNPNMYHADERAQLNRWLSEWLRVLAEHGLSRKVPGLAD
ncbi:DUF1249 domain-containing protein [Natronospirillum operosum]|uniref:DUF1249 domain-containing protein n=1 Tax=Natronospirillum operosum TaxID=2759953 RepID=A0A4Z0WF53_9GAMM|nr:DUF1249 domain-containing protein [Natronospirillum operosum]TGG92928.1 DUF1249 domain-containing protein [Natronospirillum operosum]